LRELVDKSLVVADETPDGTRYRLLETLRAYAAEQAEKASQETSLSRRHAQWYVEMAEGQRPDQPDARQMARIAPEQDNLRAVLRWSIDTGEAEFGFRLVRPLHLGLWYLRGQYAEGSAWLAELLALPSATVPSALRARALAAAGHLAARQGRLSEAQALLDEGIVLSRQSGAEIVESLCWHMQGNVARVRGALYEAEEDYRRSASLAGSHPTAFVGWASNMVASVRFELDDPEGVRRALAEIANLSGVAGDQPLQVTVLSMRAWLAAVGGDVESAHALEDQAVALARTTHDHAGLLFASQTGARSAFKQGDRQRAAQHLEVLLTAADEAGEQYMVTRASEAIAALVAEEHPDSAISLLAATSLMRQRYGFQRTPVEAARLETWLGAAQSVIGHAGQARALAEGESRTREQTIALALRLTHSVALAVAAVPTPVEQLTTREQEVAVLIVRGCTNEQIAQELVITLASARAHIEHILDRLGLQSRAQIAAWAVANRLEERAEH
jgi:non-specific serine/threonine protein kinase